MRPRIGLAVLASVGLMVSSTGGALAHVVLEQPEATTGKAYKAVFKVPHGCQGSPTTGISVEIPEGVIAVKPMPKPGWTIATTRGAYAKGYAFYHGMTLSEGVKTVSWSGGSLDDEHYDEFVVSAFIAKELSADQTLVFPVVQTCEKGETRWVEVPAAGQSAHDLKSPAASLKLVAPKGDHSHH
ncbi:MAG: YcnI family copper-binding membrane protein [Hyphomicrobium sp.]